MSWIDILTIVVSVLVVWQLLARKGFDSLAHWARGFVAGVIGAILVPLTFFRLSQTGAGWIDAPHLTFGTFFYIALLGTVGMGLRITFTRAYHPKDYWRRAGKVHGQWGRATLVLLLLTMGGYGWKKFVLRHNVTPVVAEATK